MQKAQEVEGKLIPPLAVLGLAAYFKHLKLSITIPVIEVTRENNILDRKSHNLKNL